MGALDGKVAVVTGSGSGIGFAVAERFAREGAQVLLAGRDTAKLEAAAAQIGHGAASHPVDLAVDADVQSLFESIPRVDVLATCTGGAFFDPIEKVTPELARQQFSVRFFGQLSVCHHAVPRMPAGSAIVFYSSAADRVGQPYLSVTAAISGAVNGLTKALSVELGPRGIRVNAVSPGLIDDLGLHSSQTREELSRFVQDIATKIPLRRVGLSAEVADASFFLATNPYVTGQILQVDGGWSTG